MSDTTRTAAIASQEYNNLAFKAGNLQYQIVQLETELRMINETLRTLALEWNSLQQAEQAAAKAAAAQPQQAPTQEAPVTS